MMTVTAAAVLRRIGGIAAVRRADVRREFLITLPGSAARSRHRPVASARCGRWRTRQARASGRAPHRLGARLALTKSLFPSSRRKPGPRTSDVRWPWAPAFAGATTGFNFKRSGLMRCGRNRARARGPSRSSRRPGAAERRCARDTTPPPPRRGCRRRPRTTSPSSMMRRLGHARGRSRPTSASTSTAARSVRACASASVSDAVERDSPFWQCTRRCASGVSANVAVNCNSVLTSSAPGGRRPGSGSTMSWKRRSSR